MKPTGLKELAALRATLQQREREAAERARREQAERAAADAEQRLFAHHVGPVTPLVPQRRAEVAAPRPEPLPRQREADERAALQEALSDEVDIESLLLTDDGLSFRRSGVGPDVVTRLRRGHWAIQSQIDLHGLTREEARTALADYVRQSRRRGHRCVRVVHGKGLGSPGRAPVLKGKVHGWLVQKQEVLAFVQAKPLEGGAGALLVLLAAG